MKAADNVVGHVFFFFLFQVSQKKWNSVPCPVNLKRNVSRYVDRFSFFFFFLLAFCLVLTITGNFENAIKVPPPQRNVTKREKGTLGVHVSVHV